LAKGYLALIFHAHLPFVYEAISEAYIPLLIIMNRLIQKGVDFRLTMNISPSLLSMLNDKLLQERYQRHLEKLIELSEKEQKRTVNDKEFHSLAGMYNYLFKEAYYYYHEKYNNNLLKGFKEFRERGKLEIITSAATHSYLPLILTEEAINAQIQSGVETYQDYFQEKPQGIWLPECAFKPELDPVLAENNLRYFISSSHGLLYATPRPRYGLFAPVYTPSGVAAFGRDIESSKQVWSADEGYPGDYNYREFYRDIGYDLDYDYIKSYLPSGIRKHTGLKYYGITGKSNWKEPYNPDNAREKAAEHAGNFLFNRQHQVSYLNQILDRNPILVAPYDAELFGHWWFEGPQWLEFLLEKIHYDQDEIKTITLSEYLDIYPKNQVAMPTEASWGYKGYHEVWLNGANDWIYKHLHQAELKMIDLADKYSYHSNTEELEYRALNQLCRELLLAQSSDWAFIMKAGTMVDYAVFRTKKHLHQFFNLVEELENNHLREDNLKELEKWDNIFPTIDFKIYQKKRKKLRKEG